MTTLEQVSSKGLPLPETCIKLDWQKETSYVLCKSKKSGDYYYENDLHLSSPFASEFVCYVPQFHDLMTIIGNTDGGVDLRDNFFMTDNYGYKVENNHFVEALANLYLQLKENG